MTKFDWTKAIEKLHADKLANPPQPVKLTAEQVQAQRDARTRAIMMRPSYAKRNHV